MYVHDYVIVDFKHLHILHIPGNVNLVTKISHMLRCFSDIQLLLICSFYCLLSNSIVLIMNN